MDLNPMVQKKIHVLKLHKTYGSVVETFFFGTSDLVLVHRSRCPSSSTPSSGMYYPLSTLYLIKFWPRLGMYGRHCLCELCSSIKIQTRDFMYKEKLPALVMKTQKLPPTQQMGFILSLNWLGGVPAHCVWPARLLFNPWSIA